MSLPAYDALLQKLDRFIRKYYLNQLVRGSIYLAAVLLISYLVFVLFEYFGYFSSTVRGSFFYGFLLLNAGIFAWKVLPPLLHFFRLGNRIDHEQASAIIGTHFSDIKDKLLNVLQLRRQANATLSATLIDASINQKVSLLQPVPFTSAIRIADNRRYMPWALAPLAVIFLIAVTAPSVISDGTLRVVNYDRFYAPEAPFIFHVKANLNATRGEDVQMEVVLSGDEFPDELFLTDEDNTFKLDKKSINRFIYVFRNVQENVHFRLKSHDFYSNEYVLKVKKKPELLSADVVVLFPAYLRRKNQSIANASDLTIPAGTLIRWNIRAKNTDKIDATPVLIRPAMKGRQGFIFEGRFKKNTAQVFYPQNDEAGKADPVTYQITVIPDQPPSISVVEKQDSISTSTRYFSGQIQDDHGFSRLEFHYTVKRNGEKAARSFRQNVNPEQKDRASAAFFYAWSLKKVNARPGDEVTYHFEVWDNDGVNGPKCTKSQVYTIAVPTKNDMQKQLDAGSKSVQQKMQTASKLAAELENDAKRINRNLLNKNDLSYEERKQIEELLKKKKELDDLMKDISQENEKNAFQRNETGNQDKTLQEKQRELDQLFNKTLNEETRQLLKNIQKLLEQNAKEQTQQQMGKMQTDNKSLQKELDRMKELYKQLAFEQKLIDEQKQLNDLSKRQNELSEKGAGKKPNSQQLKEEQQKLNAEFDQVKKAMEELDKQNQSLERPANFDQQKELQEQISQKMQQSAGQLGKNQPEKAAQNQQQSAQKMQQMAQKMQQMQQQGASQQLNTDVGELRRLLDNLVTASFEQEKVMKALRASSPADPGYTLFAQKQKYIQDNLKNVMDSLYVLSKRVPQIETSVNKEAGVINERTKGALENLGERQSGEALRDQQYVMTALNNLALMLNEALDKLQNMVKNASGSGKSNQPSLSQLQKMQQELNQNMQKAREQMQQEGNDEKKGHSQQVKSEQYARMARQQQQIREALQRIAQQEIKEGRSLGGLNKIQQQMEQSEQDLVNKRLTDEMLRRQKDIRIKMLEAENAQQEKEQEKQRESKTGSNLMPGRQNAMKAFHMLQKKQIQQFRTLTPQISPFYKLKINAYFEQLNKNLP